VTEIEWSESALRELRKLDKQVARRIAAAVTRLGDDPRPQQARPLQGQPGHRLRVAKDYRVIYILADDMVTIIAVGHRSQIYDY
jgi:mRNA interferase RelE/StbE